MADIPSKTNRGFGEAKKGSESLLSTLFEWRNEAISLPLRPTRPSITLYLLDLDLAVLNVGI